MTSRSTLPFILSLIVVLPNGNSAFAEHRLRSKFALTEPTRTTREQPTIPDEYRELPFVETAPKPIPTKIENRRGYILFHRPITEPVHANTYPLDSERLPGDLTAFATPGEWEPVTLGVYPLRYLKKFQIQVSDLKSSNSRIDARNLTIRLQTYWNIGYPRYASRDTYRRVPELLERVNTHNCPAGECQRWWIQIHVPDDARPGRYHGTVTVQDDGFLKAVTIPLSLHVLSFALQADPAKSYSAYYNPHDTLTYTGKDKAFFSKASANEYQAMRDYGIDMFATFYLGADSQATKISLHNEEEIERMKRAGMKGRIPILGGNAIGRIYRATTPGGKRGSHWKISKMPSPEFYEKVTALFRAFEAERVAKGLPPMICCPLDEVAASHREFGIKVFQAVQAAGMPTYITKFPTAADAREYNPYVDVWCSQPFAIPYERIVAQERHEYWSYPNHNAGERKNRRIMCKGGRMTYGFGFWRSGYTTLIPWHWSWTMKPGRFDYLRSAQSGCGMRIGDDGEVIPALYWECFREGRDDGRYIYTLQQAVFERDGSGNPKCQQCVNEAKATLQETWDAITVQERYLADGMWPSEEFNTRRWLLASMIERLLAFPAKREGRAPSVLAKLQSPNSAADTASVLNDAMADGIVTARDVGEDFSRWLNGTMEGQIDVTTNASVAGSEAKGMRWKVKVDHFKGENPDHLTGWPRIARNFKRDELDLSGYDFLEFMIRVDSDRDEVADDVTKFGLSIRNYGEPGRLYEIRKDLGDQQQVWIPLRFSIKEMINTTALGTDPWKRIKTLQLFIAESDYQDQTAMTFDIGSAKLLSFARPLISRVETPRHLMLPLATFPVAFDVLGLSSVTPGSHTVTAELSDASGKTKARQQQDLAQATAFHLNAAGLTAGRHMLTTWITTAAGDLCSESKVAIEAVAGPFAQ